MTDDSHIEIKGETPRKTKVVFGVAFFSGKRWHLQSTHLFESSTEAVKAARFISPNVHWRVFRLELPDELE